MSWVRAPPAFGVKVIACNGTTPSAVGCIEDLREKREELNRSILRDEEEKGKIQKVRGLFISIPAAAQLHTPLSSPLSLSPTYRLCRTSVF